MLLPLLGGCAAAYFISFIMMKSTIMTEKIARRGITTPESYVPDILNSYKVGHVLKEEVSVLDMNNTIGDARKFILENDEKRQFTSFAIVDDEGDLYGVIGMKEIFNENNGESEELGRFAKLNPVSIYEDEILKSAVDKMLANNLEILPIVSRMKLNQLVGILSYRDILEAYELREKEAVEEGRTISIRKQSIRIIIKGRRFLKK
jgi:chloride channel protein, CIC family